MATEEKKPVPEAPAKQPSKKRGDSTGTEPK